MSNTSPTFCAGCLCPDQCRNYGACMSYAALLNPDNPTNKKPGTADAIQIGGDHYKGFGAYQPWTVFEHWYPTEEFLAYLMMSAIAYLPRERMKGGVQDVKKAIHTLQKWVEVREANPVKNQ